MKPRFPPLGDSAGYSAPTIFIGSWPALFRLFPEHRKKGAALLEALIRNHGFADGNKRTAVLLLDLLLQRSGYNLPRLEEDAVSIEFEELVVGIADRRNDFNDAYQWLRRHCQPQDS